MFLFLGSFLSAASYEGSCTPHVLGLSLMCSDGDIT